MTPERVAQIAKIIHNCTVAFALGVEPDYDIVSWGQLEGWETHLMFNKVIFKLNNPNIPEGSFYDAWQKYKKENPQVYGFNSSPLDQSPPTADMLSDFGIKKELIFHSIFNILNN